MPLAFRKPPFWASVFTIISIGILCTLGTWQLQRLEWKEALLAKVEAQKEQRVDDIQAADLNEDNEHKLVSFIGKALPEETVFLGTYIEDGNPGYHVYMPVKLPDGSYILENSGWVPYGHEDFVMRNRRQLEKIPATFFGRLQKTPKPNYFTPQNPPKGRVIFRLDEAEQWQGLDINREYAVYKVQSMDQEGRASPHGFGEDYVARAIKNDHAQYAAFWFSMAFVLIFVFMARFVIRKD